MSVFIPGLELNRRFYTEIVRPLLEETFPELSYAAALIGPGSETLGFDSAMSMDHDWAARVFLFLKTEDASQRYAIANLLSHRLPPTFLGAPVHMPEAPDEPRTQIMKLTVDGPVNHLVIPITLQDFVRIQLDYDLEQPLRVTDWLTFPSHTLGEVTAGEVYHDGNGELTTLRAYLAWYPHDIWLYLLASGWQRISQEEHLMPRAGSAGDELGSALIGSRLVRDIMNLCFLLERQYAPYPKWFGTAFKRLRSAQDLWPILWQAQQAPTWQERETCLVRAYEYLAQKQNMLLQYPQRMISTEQGIGAGSLDRLASLSVANGSRLLNRAPGISRKLPETVSRFYSRPFQVIHGGQFAQALVEQISDPEVKHIAEQRLIGNINQWSDNTDIEGIERANRRKLYD